MRQIAVINQKGGVGKTTTSVNLAAALASLGRRVVVVDMDPQANLSLHVDRVAPSGDPSVYTVLIGSHTFEEAIFDTATPGLRIVPSNIDLSGAETELASAMGRETILGEAINRWVSSCKDENGRSPADYVIFDCPPSLGLLALNALATSGEVLLTVQTEFLALQGMSKLVEIVQLVRQRLNDKLKITGILPCMYDTRLRLAREVLSEIRKYFPGQVFKQPIGTNVKLAEAPSFGETIIQYAPDSKGAADYRAAALEVIAQEARDPELADLPRPKPPEPPKAKTSAKPKPKPKPAAKAPKTGPKADEREEVVQEANPAKLQPSEAPLPKATLSEDEQQAEVPEPEAAPKLAEKVINPVPPPNPIPRTATSNRSDAQPVEKIVTTPDPKTPNSQDSSTRDAQSNSVTTQPEANEKASSTDPPAASAHEEESELQERVITPPAKAAESDEPSGKRRVGPKMLRAENLPPLPRDAFDNYLDSMQGY